MRAKSIGVWILIVVRIVQVVGVDITRVHIANIEVSIVRVSIDATFSDMPYFIIFFSSILLYILICHQFWLKILYIFLNL